MSQATLKYKHGSNRIQKYLVAFDFDQTLPVHRVYGKQSPPSKYIALFGGKSRIDMLAIFLQYLTQSHVKLVIISWNFQSVISDALQNLHLNSYFDAIYDRSEMIKNGGYDHGKANIMYLLSKQFNINKERCLMVDDCKRILPLCSHVCHTVHVKNERGITITEIKQIIKALNLTDKCSII
eukprot:85162_1